MCCDWYIAFLNCKIEEAWETLFRLVLAGTVGQTASYPCEYNITIAFHFLKEVASELIKRKELALVSIVDEMYNKDILRDVEGDDDRSTANQLVFAALGWISMAHD
jgi:hypothetical protein